ncbi:MAG: potassium transporter TrkG, partial [Erysipelotrichaceae bacterium]
MIIKKIKDDVLEFIHYDKWSPVQKIASSFLLVIFTGALLLTLPISNKDGNWLNFLDALFTSTSAVCVTGLTTVVTVETYTLFGQIVLIFLMQIGGLGLMTIMAVVILMMKNRLSMTDKILMREMLNQDTLFNMHNYVKDIFKYTFTIEAIGIGLMALVFVPEQGLFPGLFSALFTSVSAFCNAGFDIVGNSSLIPYATNGIINFTVMGLIISGGLGFSVWFDLRNRVKAVDLKAYQKQTLWVQIREQTRDFWKLLHQHTKIVLVSTLFLIVSGTLIILLLEGNNSQTLGQYGPLNKTMVAMFQSVTLRTAGFATINIGFTHDATKLMMSVFMFIGGSPGGTAGGVKTTTMFMLLLFLYSQLKNRENLYIFKRSIGKDIVMRAV